MDKEKKIEEKEKCEGGCKWKCPHMGKRVKTAVILAAVLIIGALAYFSRGFFVAATVDGFPIGRLSVMQETEKQSGKTTLENLILKRIILNETKKKGITVSNEEVAAEMTKIETMVTAQGGTLEQALTAQGITKTDLMEQIILQKKVEKLLPSKPVVTDNDVKAYITANKISVPSGKEVEYLTQTKAQMEQQKLQESIQNLVASLKEKAKVRYFINY